MRLRNLPRVLVCLILFLSVGGCGSSFEVYPVSGTVKFDDGSVPQGEIAVIRFEPVYVEGATLKGALGDIQPDGSFALTTIEPGDGAFPGDYKVVLSVIEGYPEPKSLVPEKYTKAETTPLAGEVADGGNSFEFTLEGPQ